MSNRPTKKRWDIKYNENDPPLQQAEISLEMYLLIHQHPGYAFTTRELKNVLNKRYKTTLSCKRVLQIANLLSNRNRIAKKVKILPDSSRPIPMFHSIKEPPSILYGSPSYEILKAVYKIKSEKGNLKDNDKLIT